MVYKEFDVKFEATTGITDLLYSVFYRLHSHNHSSWRLHTN